MSGIEWTDRVWNPVRGCTRVSPGCQRCYAERQAIRHAYPGGAYEGLVESRPSGPRWTGRVQLEHGRLADPLRWRRPARVFVNSMSDLFHPEVPVWFVDEVFGVMGECEDIGRGHTFQILTKRAARMREYMTTRAHAAWNAPRMGPSAFPPRNVWLGVSCEDQQRADERIPDLLETPASVRFVSAEPLLGHINTIDYLYRNVSATGEFRTHQGRRQIKLTHEGPRGDLHWIIVGGESGPRARPMEVAWYQSIFRQSREAGVAFFGKQDSGPKPGRWGRIPEEMRVREWPR